MKSMNIVIILVIIFSIFVLVDYVLASNRFCIQSWRERVLHFKFPLSITGIFRYDSRETKEGDKWG